MALLKLFWTVLFTGRHRKVLNIDQQPAGLHMSPVFFCVRISISTHVFVVTIRTIPNCVDLFSTGNLEKKKNNKVRPEKNEN
jgi:hypothetical protein